MVVLGIFCTCVPVPNEHGRIWGIEWTCTFRIDHVYGRIAGKTCASAKANPDWTGGGASHGALPKYPSNVALHKDEYAAPYGTIMRTRSGAMIAPTPTPEWFDQASL